MYLTEKMILLFLRYEGQLLFFLENELIFVHKEGLNAEAQRRKGETGGHCPQG